MYPGGADIMATQAIRETAKKEQLSRPFAVTASEPHSAHNCCCWKIAASSTAAGLRLFEVLNNGPQEVPRCLLHLHPSLHHPCVCTPLLAASTSSVPFAFDHGCPLNNFKEQD